MTRRSDCPISNTLDYVGDKWSLLILRDLMFFNKNSYSELQNSDERMATNILSKRLETLELDGLINKRTDSVDKRKKVYSLTKKGKDMLPILLEMVVWCSKYDKTVDAPKEVIRRYKTDREALIKDLQKNIKS